MAKEVKTESEAVVANAVSRTEEFLENYKKVIWGIILGAIVLCGASYAWYKFIYQPAKQEALGQMYKAEANFRNGDYELALKGDGNVLGFESIISDYGSKAGKAVYLYAAICELQLGNAENALKYLGKYSTTDPLFAGRAEALKGDALCNLGRYDEAAQHFIKASKKSDNVFNAGYLLKAGQAYEAAGKNDKALDAYKTVKDKYSQSMEGYEIDKYITRLEVK